MDKIKLPVHVAVIPDGNRRWAREKGYPPVFGHKVAVEKVVPEILKKVRDLKIKYFTLWALSTENLKRRSKEELSFLFNLLKEFIDKKIPEFVKEKVKFKTIGDLSKLPSDVREKLEKAKEKTRECNLYVFTLAINYGGRDEIIRAVNSVLKKGLDFVDQNTFGKFLDSSFAPAPDLIIRTGKEKRLSGFMLWQIEYSELYFSDLYFPEFSAEEFEKAVLDFSRRERRFGK